MFYLAARSQSPKAPTKDALWFATYPIIPRVGDCVFRDGVYYLVERVFLYENLAAGMVRRCGGEFLQSTVAR
jgi:hypothetical protein